MTKHTILFLAANPSRTDRRAFDQVAKAIHEELERGDCRDMFAFEARWAPEPLDLLRELRKLAPAVVHFSGRGDETGLIFHGRRDREDRLVSTEAFAQAFRAAGASVKLVILDACDSEAQAQALLAHVDCVIGMNGSIGDDAARAFAIGFYGGLSEPVARAFEHGRAAIGLEGLPDGDRLRLRVRKGVDATRLILAAGASRPAQTDRRAVRSVGAGIGTRADVLSLLEGLLHGPDKDGQSAMRGGAGMVVAAMPRELFGVVLSSGLAQYRTLAAGPTWDELFETITDVDAVLPAMLRDGAVTSLARDRTQYIPGREGIADTKAHLTDKLARAGGRLLLRGPGGIGKTREAAELARDLCAAGWIVCVADPEESSRIGAAVEIPAHLVDARVVIVVDKLHARITEDGTFVERFSAFLSKVERVVPDLRVLAIARGHSVLGLEDPASRRWSEVRLPALSLAAIAQMLSGLAARAGVAVEDSGELVRNSDRMPQTVIDNVLGAAQSGLPLTRSSWQPGSLQSWRERLRRVQAKHAHAHAVYQAIDLLARSGVPARRPYVVRLVRELAGADQAVAIDALLDTGLIGARNGVLSLHSEEQLRESVDGERAVSIASHHELVCRAVLDGSGDRPADRTLLAVGLVRAGLLAPAEAMTRSALAAGNRDAHGVLALVHFKRRSFVAAEAELTARLAHDPGFAPALWMRACTRLILGDLEGAAADLDASLGADPDGPLKRQWLGMRGLLHFHRGMLAEASADLEAALQVEDALAVPLYFVRSLLRERQGDHAGTEQDCDAAIRCESAFPGTVGLRGTNAEANIAMTPFARMIRANARSRQGKYAEAEADLTDELASALEEAMKALWAHLPGSSRLRADLEALGFRPGHLAMTVIGARGVIRLQLARWADAERDLDRALEDGTLAPDLLAETHALRGLARYMLGRLAEAEADLSRAIAFAPAECPPHLHVLRACCRSDLGRSAEAGADLEAAWEQGERSGAFFCLRAQHRLREGLADAAEADLDAAFDAGFDEVAAWRLRGIVRYCLGKLPEAELALDGALARSPDPQLYYLRGTVRLDRTDLVGADRDYTAAIERGADDANTYAMRAAARHARGQLGEAIEDADHALARGGADGLAFAIRGQARAARGEAIEANRDLTAAIERGAADADVFAARVLARVQLGDRAGAVSDYEAVMEYDAADHRGYVRRGFSSLMLGRWEQANSDLERALELQATSVAHCLRATVRYVLGDFAGVIRDADAAVALGGGSGVPHELVTCARIRIGDLAGAEAGCAQVTEIAPRLASIVIAQSVLDLARGALASARARLESATDAAVRPWLGLVALLSGRYGTARALYKEVGAALDAALARRELDYWSRQYADRLTNDRARQAVRDIRRMLRAAGT